MANETHQNIPNRLDETEQDDLVNPVPREKDKAENIADKFANNAANTEHEFDDQQGPFTK